MENTNEIQEQDIKLDWLTAEQQEIAKTELKQFENLPALKLEEKKIYELDIDFSKAFERWSDPINETVKRIIPVVYNGQRMSFWINQKNPLFREIIKLGITKQTKIKLIRTGLAQDTRYSICK